MTIRAAATDNQKDWIPLVEYALKKGVSLSTLRRHIKAGKIPFKVDQGRYLLFDDSPETSLHESLQRAQEEIAELKTLIALYEEKIPNQRQGL
jgi:hypothetical protein